MSVGLIPMSESVRKNGFQSPLNKYQILTWVALLWSVLVHYLVLVPSYPTQRDQTYIAVQYAWFYIIGIPTFFYVSTYDTTARYLRMKLLGIPASSIGTQELRYCDKCEVSMAPKTKHCGWCKKCVGYFDHHCLYLNVCITSRNHQSYIMLLLMVSAASCFQCIYAIHRVVHQGEADFVAELEVSLFAGMSEHSFLVLLCLFSLIPLGVFFCTFVLFVFHLYLIMTGTTTYTYVMKQRNIARNEAGMQEMDEGSGTDIEMAERRSQQHHHQHQQPTDPASDSDESIEGLAPIREEEGEEKRNNGAHTLDTGNNDNSDEEIQYDHHKDTEQSDENVQDVEVGPSATPMKAVDDDTPGDPLPPPPLPPQQRPPARGLARESNTHQGKKKKPVNEHKRKNPCYRFPHRKKKCSCFRNCVGAVNSVSIDPVIPGLFISSLPAAYKKETLLELGVSHIVDLSNEEYFKHPCFEYLSLKVDDSSEENLYRFFRHTNDFIDGAVHSSLSSSSSSSSSSSNRSSVLVHCYAGVSRAATVVLAYLLWKKEWDLNQSLDVLRQARPRVHPNPGFTRQLKHFEQELGQERSFHSQ